jgi:hypothetical protein
MARDATSKFGAATMNPGDVRNYGIDAGTYQAPTRAQQYADSLGLEPGSDEYETAIRDQELNANGPTAFKNQQTMQGIRAASSMALQSQRDAQARARAAQAQRGRMEIRGAPAYRDLNPLPPRASGRSAAPRKSGERTATDANGNTVFYRGGRWVDAQGQPVQ